MKKLQEKHVEILTHCKEGRFHKAFDTYNEFLSHNGESAVLLRWLADIYGMQGDLHSEARTLKSAIELDLSCTAAYYSLCRNRLKSGEIEESIVAGRRVVELEQKESNRPFSSSAYFMLAYSYKKLGRIEEFAEVLEFVDETQTEWLGGRLLAKNDLVYSA